MIGGDPQGLVLPPHVFVDATNDMSIAQDELFGPVIVHHRSARRGAGSPGRQRDALRSVERGGHARRRARAPLRERFQAGMSHVNDSPVNDIATSPFGGEKNSGLGRYNGEWAIEEFTTPHLITVQHVPIRYPF